MFQPRLSSDGIETSAYYQDQKFNSAKGTDNDMPNCTDYADCRIWESCEVDKPFVIFQGRSATGYPIAKDWFKDAMLPKGYDIKEGAIAVFDGNYGHVAYVEEKIDDTHAVISQSYYDSDKSLRNYRYWNKMEAELVVGEATLSGIGPLIGFIYLPIHDIRVKRDYERSQIEIIDSMVNVRVKPNGDKFAKGLYCPKGIFNVLEKENDGQYDWFMIEENHWVREGEWLRYYPVDKDEIVELKKRIAELENRLKEIHTLSEV